MDIKTTPKTNDLVTTFTFVERSTTTKGNYDFKSVVRAFQHTIEDLQYMIEDLEFRSIIDHIREVLREAGTRQSTSDLNRQ